MKDFKELQEYIDEIKKKLNKIHKIKIVKFEFDSYDEYFTIEFIIFYNETNFTVLHYPHHGTFDKKKFLEKIINDYKQKIAATL